MHIWTAITDREAPMGERLLVLQCGCIRIATLMPGYLGHPSIWAVEGAHHAAGITHWMPLPEPPA
jgi:hypothetical protein